MTQRFAQLSDPHLSTLNNVHPRDLLNKRALGYLSWLHRRRHEHRREVLDAELFHSLLEAHVLSERWRRLYNERRPHSRLGYRPPITAYLPAQQAIG